MQTDAPKSYRGPRAWRIIRTRPRLFACSAVGIAATLALSGITGWRPAMRGLVGWDIGVGLYVILAGEMMSRADVQQIRRRAAAQDEGAVVTLVMTVAAGLASLLAIVAFLGTQAGTGPRNPGELILATITIGVSWVFIQTMFALHYAHEFYDESGGHGMAFPGGEEEPDYWDFFYFAVVIGMTSQVSDVGIVTKEIRRIVTVHGIVSFFFNAALLALMVNIAASAI